MKQGKFRHALYELLVGRSYLFFPFFCLAYETWAARGYPFGISYFWPLLMRQKWLGAHAFLASARVTVFYLLFFCLLEFLFRAMHLSRSRTKIFLSLMLYSGLVKGIQILKPTALSGWHPQWALALGILAGAIVVAALWAREDLFRLRRASSPLLPYVLICVVFLIFSRIEEHEPDSSARPPGPASLPSFVLIGMDGIPADFFYRNNAQGSATPLWEEHFRPKAHTFLNAYTVTNSTYTTWHSILSGLHPVQSKVEWLYSAHRRSAAPLLPEQLQAKGYKTVFMTDCGTTSHMEKGFGFDELIQRHNGAYGCLRGAIVGSHPLAFLGWPGLLFPEREGFCSKLYRPQTFFSEVQQTLDRLSEKNAPYFLAIHSCVTHQDVVAHLPALYTEHRKKIPSQTPPVSGKESQLLTSLRWLDSLLAPVIEQTQHAANKPWVFLFSDHGVRIEIREGEKKFFSHAYGPAVNRYQYHVPLVVLPGKEGSHRPRGSHPEQVSLLDIPKTIRQLAALKDDAPDGRDLREVWDAGEPSAYPLLLTSSLPLLAPGDRLDGLLSESTFHPSGHLTFNPELEKKLADSRSVALLNLPYRLVYHPNHPFRLYHEWEDPMNQRDLAALERENLQRLKRELCTLYPTGGCEAVPEAMP